MPKRGRFIVVDGLDGVGKGVFLDTFVHEAKKDDKKIFDAHKFWNQEIYKHPNIHNSLKRLGLSVQKWTSRVDYHPDPNHIIGRYDILLTSEPTFVGIGRYIRKELIAKNPRKYSPEAVAQAYALDRQILYESLVLPCLKAGIDVYQSRSLSTSITYQRQTALDLGRDFTISDILSIPGNAFCYAHPMDFLIIPTINDVQEAIRRSQARAKKDDCRFENLTFQLKLKQHYESEEFRKIFERKGIIVTYLDAGVSIDFSKQQAREFYQKNLR